MASDLLDDEEPEVSALVLQERNEVIEEDVELWISFTKRNDNREFGVGFAVAWSPLSSLHHAAAVSRFHCLL